MLTSSGGSEIIIEMLQSAGASPIVDGKVDLVNNKALKKAIETYKQLIDEGIMVDYTDWDQYIASMNKEQQLVLSRDAGSCLQFRQLTIRLENGLS